MTTTPKTKINIDKKYFELVLAYNSIFNPRYLGSIVDHYDPDYFENDDLKILMPIIVDFFKRRNEPPTLSEIKTYLSTEDQKEAFKNLLINFKSLDKTFNEDELYENTENFLRERAVYKAIKNSASKLTSNSLDVAEILPEFEKACTISLVDDLGFNYFQNVEEHCKDLSKYTEVLSSGINWLDERIGGGWFKEGRQLIIFAGRTNVGKSIVLGNMALNILKQNKKVLLITLEMPETLYAKRFSSQITNIPINELTRNIDGMKTTILNFKAMQPDAELYIKEFPPKAVTVNHINSYIKKLKQKGCSFDAIIVDYINLIRPNKSNGSSYEDIKTISENLRATSYMFKVPVISASQFNRKGLSAENPDMDAISESVGLTFTADLQISLWSSDQDRAAGIINISIQKNRYGPVNECTALNIDYNTLLISESDTRIDTRTSSDTALEDTLSRLSDIEYGK